MKRESLKEIDFRRMSLAAIPFEGEPTGLISPRISPPPEYTKMFTPEEAEKTRQNFALETLSEWPDEGFTVDLLEPKGDELEPKGDEAKGEAKREDQDETSTPEEMNQDNERKKDEEVERFIAEALQQKKVLRSLIRVAWYSGKNRKKRAYIPLDDILIRNLDDKDGLWNSNIEQIEAELEAVERFNQGI